MNHGVRDSLDRFRAAGLEHVAGFVHGMRHQKQAGKTRGHEQRPGRITIGRIANCPRLVKFHAAAGVAGLKLIIEGGIFTVDGVPAAVQHELRDRLFAGQVGILIKIFLNIFSSLDQGIERGRSVRRPDFTGQSLGSGESGHQREHNSEGRGAEPCVPD